MPSKEKMRVGRLAANSASRIPGIEHLRAMRTLISTLRPERRSLVILACYAAASSGSTLGICFLAGQAAGALRASAIPSAKVGALIAGILLSGLAGAIANGRQADRIAAAAARITQDLQLGAFDRRMNEDAAVLVSEPPGGVVNAIVRDLQSVPYFLLNAFSIVISSGVVLVTALCAIGSIDYRLVFIMFLAVLIIAVPLRRLAGRLDKAYLRSLRGRSVLQVFLSDRLQVSGIKIARNYEINALFRDQFQARTADLQASVGDMEGAAGRMNALAVAGNTGLVAIVLLMASARVTAGGIDIASLVFLLLVSPLLIQVVQNYSVVTSWLSTATNILDMLQLSGAPRDFAAARAAAVPTKPALPLDQAVAAEAPIARLSNIWFRYRPTRYSLSPAAVLRGVSFDIYPRELLSIVGEVGCGKSTLALLLAGLLRPSDGSISVSPETPGGRWGRVRLIDSQDWFFTGTISENIRVVDPGLSLQEMVRICDSIGLHHFIAQLPQGYETIVGERGARLSGGQRQLLAIARAMADRPGVVILDEATTCLDAEAERRAIDGLRAHVPGPVILIAHRLASVRLSDRVVVLSDGQVAGAGTHDELVESCAPYAELHKLQMI